MTNRETILEAIEEIKFLSLMLDDNSSLDDLHRIDGICNRLIAKSSAIRFRITQILDGKE